MTIRYEIPDCTRRSFLGGALLVAAGASFTVPRMSARAAQYPPNAVRAGSPVVAFHADQLYIDRSGKVEAFVPPGGCRSLDGLCEETLWRVSNGW